MRTAQDCWGRYRATVDERLAACEDYLGRLRRSFAGEIAPDRFYFAEKAHSLRDAAQALVDRVDDIEWWLGACTAEIVGDGPYGDGTDRTECGRAAGHTGPHQPEGRGQEERVIADTRAVAAELRRLTDRLAWGLLAASTDDGVTDPRTLASELREVQRRLSPTASSLDALASGPSSGSKGQ